MVLCRMLSISARPANWSFSSKCVMAMYPNSVLMDLIFIGSSAPRNMIFCPVGLKISSSGDFLASQYSATPSASMLQRYWVYTESRRVFATFLRTRACASGCSISRRITVRLAQVDFVLPRPPLASKWVYRCLRA